MILLGVSEIGVLLLAIVSITSTRIIGSDKSLELCLSVLVVSPSVLSSIFLSENFDEEEDVGLTV